MKKKSAEKISVNIEKSLKHFFTVNKRMDFKKIDQIWINYPNLGYVANSQRKEWIQLIFQALSPTYSEMNHIEKFILNKEILRKLNLMGEDNQEDHITEPNNMKLINQYFDINLIIIDQKNKKIYYQNNSNNLPSIILLKENNNYYLVSIFSNSRLVNYFNYYHPLLEFIYSKNEI